MSRILISRSSDLKRLRDEGYEVTIEADHLVVRHVPYVNVQREIRYGALISELSMAGDVTTRPGTHVVHFQGDHPCNPDGTVMIKIKHQSSTRSLGDGLVVNHSFSSKPPDGYTDHYLKMTTYANIISAPAHKLDPSVTARTYPVVEPDVDETVFKYLDTASTRAEIGVVTEKLKNGKVAIVGLGGTGSYVLDLVAKTPVPEIHLYDADSFKQHNAFRSPGAPSVADLREVPSKIAYFERIYSQMHGGIIVHSQLIDQTNVDELRDMNFVFLCLDRSEVKRLIVQKLDEGGVAYIDVGIGVNLVDTSLRGILRVTCSTSQKRDHLQNRHRIPFADGDGDNEYSLNIQIAELNALNAALAVIKWKKLKGFYDDDEKEYFTTYIIAGNSLINEEKM